MNGQIDLLLGRLRMEGRLGQVNDRRGRSWEWSAWSVDDRRLWKAGRAPSREAAERDMLSWLTCEERGRAV